MNMFAVYQILVMVIAAMTWTLIGQGVLALLLGPRRTTNFVYRFMAGITYPVIRLTRALMPRFIVDAHIGFIALFLLLLLRLVVYMVFYSQGWIPSVSGPVIAPEQPT